MSMNLEFFHFLLVGGNTSVENNPKHDGDDGTSFLSPEVVPFLSVPLKGNATRIKAGWGNKVILKDCHQCVIGLRKCVSSTGYVCRVYRQELMCLHFPV